MPASVINTASENSVALTTPEEVSHVRRWEIPSRNGSRNRTVTLETNGNEVARWSCDCPDWIFRRRSTGGVCWHIRQVQRHSHHGESLQQASNERPAGASNSASSVPLQNSIPARQKTIWQIVRKQMKNSERKYSVKQSLDILKKVRAKYPSKCQQDGLVFKGPDFLIDPRRDHIVYMPLSEESFAFYRIHEIRDEAKRMARTLKGNLYGLGSVRFKTTDPATGRETFFLQVGLHTYRIERKGQLVEVRLPLETNGHCPRCNKTHILWGMEIEFDAPRIANLTSKECRQGSMSFVPIGRDGAGQGEVRSVPSNSFLEAAQSVVTHYRAALKIIEDCSDTVKMFRKFYSENIAKNPNINKQGLDILHDEETQSPNAVHIHGPRDPYVDELLRIVAIWWNQKDTSSKEMLERRINSSYGKISGSNVTRQSGVCQDNRFTEYRCLNSDSPDNIERLLFPVINEALNRRPVLPRVAKEYKNPSAFSKAESFCLSLIGITKEVIGDVQDGAVLQSERSAGIPALVESA